MKKLGPTLAQPWPNLDKTAARIDPPKKGQEGVLAQGTTPSPPLGGGKGVDTNFGPNSPTPDIPLCAKVGRRLSRKRKPTLTIIEDTREQTPLTEWPEGVAVEQGTLHTGDYSVKGWENCFAVERKSLKDFAGTMIAAYESKSEKPKKRFNRQLERMRHFDFAAVVVTATVEEVLNFHHHCGLDAHGALWGFALSIQTTYGIPVHFLGTERIAAKWIADAARHYVAVRTKKNFSKADLSAKMIADWSF